MQSTKQPTMHEIKFSICHIKKVIKVVLSFSYFEPVPWEWKRINAKYNKQHNILLCSIWWECKSSIVNSYAMQNLFDKINCILALIERTLYMLVCLSIKMFTIPSLVKTKLMIWFHVNNSMSFLCEQGWLNWSIRWCTIQNQWPRSINYICK